MNDSPCPRCGTIFDHTPAPGANMIECPNCGLTAAVSMLRVEAPDGVEMPTAVGAAPTEMPPEFAARLREQGLESIRQCDFTVYSLADWNGPVFVSGSGGRPFRLTYLGLAHQGPDVTKRVEVGTHVDELPPEAHVHQLLMNLWHEPGAQTDELRAALLQMESLEPWSNISLTVDGVSRPAHYLEGGLAWRVICPLDHATVTIASNWLDLDHVALVSVDDAAAALID